MDKINRNESINVLQLLFVSSVAWLMPCELFTTERIRQMRRNKTSENKNKTSDLRSVVERVSKTIECSAAHVCEGEDLSKNQ